MFGNIFSAELITQILVFGGLAIMRTIIIDIVGWRYLVAWMKQNPKSWEYVKKIKLNVYSYSHGITFIVSSISSYFLNRFITFAKPEVEDETRIFVEFMIISIFSLIISVAMINILTSNKMLIDMVDKIPLLKRYWPITAKLITIAFVMVINFVGYKFYVFL